MSQIVAGNRRISRRALLPAIAALALAACTLAAIACMLALAPAARAGEWVQRSCSVGTEYIFPEGWESKDVGGYAEAPNDNCERFYNGGGLRVDIAPMDAGYLPLAGQMWSYKPPAGSTIAGGSLAVDMTAREGAALIGAKVKGNIIELAKCESPGCFQYIRDVSITAVGASEIYEQAACHGKAAVCRAPEGEPFEHEGDGVFSAEAEISSAQILLSTNAVPAASGLGGTLLNSTVTGKATLSFTATDSAGPGVYQVRVKVNGEQVLAETPNLNEGKCVSTGTSEGARAFNYAQPCPTETPVHAEINTAGLPDGIHALTVELEDAAGDVATVYSGTLSTLNHLVSTILQPAPVRGPANGTPASESAILTGQWKGSKSAKSGKKSATRLTSVYGRPHEITGKLSTAAGAPIAGALIEASQKPASLGAAASSIAGTHTDPQGNFTINLPSSSSSSSIQLVYRSHLGDATPAATQTLTLQIPASIHLTVSPHVTSVGRTIVLDGKLAGAIPPGGKKVLFEARVAGGSWIEFHNATVDSHGRFRATHRFTFSGPIHYQFRVVCEHEADFPFLAGNSNVVHVWER
jgi:hypothetical protein